MRPDTVIGIVGDTHGHLQLACCVMASWQEHLGVEFEAVLLCGDVGSFSDPSQLDSTTRAHAKRNPCELEFLHQWSAEPQAPWLDWIFKPCEEGGLGLLCPVVMVHGNHEGFAHIERLVPAAAPADPIAVDRLPAVDTNGHIRLLPSGWVAELPSGYQVAGVGGIQPGQRAAQYHPMAYLDDNAVERTLAHGPVDVLVTHQGPSGVQGKKGSELLQVLLDEGIARVWFHGHSRDVTEPTPAGPRRRCLVVPLGDIAFHVPKIGASKGFPYEPGEHGWAVATLRESHVSLTREPPPMLRDFHRHKWVPKDGQLLCPTLAPFLWRPEQDDG